MLKLKCMTDQKFVVTTPNGERLEIFWSFIKGIEDGGNWLCFDGPRDEFAVTRERLGPGETCGEVGK